MEKIKKARAALIVRQPFFAALIMGMPMLENNDIPTMATDGESILYNKAWTESLSLDEIIFVLAHEALHCVFDHMGRRGNRSPNRYNQAADYVINQTLKNDGIGTMPALGLYDPGLYARGNGITEKIYDLLPESSENKNAGTPGGALDHVSDSGTDNGKQKTDPAKQAKTSQDTRIRVIAAMNTAKMQGKLGAGVARLLGDILKPENNWKNELRKFFDLAAKNEYTYARPKRRFLAEDLYLASLTGKKCGKIAIAVDCSGSIDQKTIDIFSAEINAIRDDVAPESIEIVYFDSQVTGTQSIESDDTLKLKPIGGGGTAFSPVFEYLNAMESPPVCTIFLTDLYCDEFGHAPEYPVLWASYGNNSPRAPFGEIIKIEEN